MSSDTTELSTKTLIQALTTDEREHIDKFVAYPKTLVPMFDIEAAFPMLQPKFTTILHPRQVETPLPVTASKIGGHVYWPRSEPWPCCDYEGHESNPLLAVMQLRKRDARSLDFPPGKNLFQMLWCPNEEHDCIEAQRVPKQRFFWRTINETEQQQIDLLPANEVPQVENEEMRQVFYIPHECAVYPERVKEYPSLASFDNDTYDELDPKIADWLEEKTKPYTLGMTDWDADIYSDYHYSWSTSRSTKIGGYPLWIQDHFPQNCEKCGKSIQLFLTIASLEYEGRWYPIEEEKIKRDQHEMIFGDVGNYFVYACRVCEGMPTKSFLQCG